MKKPDPKKEAAREAAPKGGGNHDAPHPTTRASAISKDDLERFRRLLLTRRELLHGNVNQMENEALHRNRQDSSGDLSSMPIHIADLGTDNFEQEFTLGLIESEEEELREIEEALGRIDAGGYGDCETCAKPITRERLRAIPYARLCIECKKKQEEVEE
ncbi:MAG: TraR/DksA C4-type zinc finger protein [Planctomycetes bacterium]|nr:TraR/DksA C4-type zinc finger protein [Planctomycetota bacterium]